MYRVKILQLLALIICLSYSFPTIAQKLPERALQLTLGYGKHGSGDLNGIIFGAEYTKHYQSKVSLNYNFRGSIHTGKDEIIVNGTPNGIPIDASVRYTTAGVQFGVDAGYSFVRNSNNEMRVSFGPFARYQSASNGSDGYAMYNPNQTGIPTVLIGYFNRTPQQTISIGGILQLNYNYTFNNKNYVGIVTGFQTDTNGDVMPQVGLAIGTRF
jgi:hypothetical protein